MLCRMENIKVLNLSCALWSKAAVTMSQMYFKVKLCQSVLAAYYKGGGGDGTARCTQGRWGNILQEQNCKMSKRLKTRQSVTSHHSFCFIDYFNLCLSPNNFYYESVSVSVSISISIIDILVFCIRYWRDRYHWGHWPWLIVDQYLSFD